jgi:hypothetical protein
MAKVGRNNPCPCGSGIKFKKCCYMNAQSEDEQIRLNIQKMRAKVLQIQKQQGLGREIISWEFKDYRMVAVGSQIHWAKSAEWKTFHDFLSRYFIYFFTKKWADEQMGKSPENRHPVFLWREMTFQFMKDNGGGSGDVNTAVMTGAVAAHFYLAYNLYLLAHNVGIQERLVRRLKDINLFRGALYETYVAAEFIKAGFSLEIENEEDKRSTHCEFTAISRKTGRKYSIEAKAREPNKQNVGIGNQLHEAFKKDAKYERVIFIDVNTPSFVDKIEIISKEIRDKERTLTIKGEPAPSAYIFVTNHPFEYDLEGVSTQQKSGFVDGYKIPDFNFDVKFFNIRDVLKSRKNHEDILHLIKSIQEHHEIPSTFDAEPPELAHGSVPVRLIIGNKYVVPDENGNSEPAILVTAAVSQVEKKIYGIYKTLSGKQITCANPITEEELIAYIRQPETFFGVPLQVVEKISTPMDFFDSCYKTYRNSTKEELLEFLKDSPDFNNLKNLDQEELAISYCERFAYAAARATHKKSEVLAVKSQEMI